MLGRFSITNRLTAKNLDLPVEKVASVMEFVIKELEEEMVSCNHTFINVKNLGTFGLNCIGIEKSVRKLMHIKQWHERCQLVEYLPRRQKTINTLKSEIYDLLQARRKIIKQSKHNKELRCSLKS